MAPSVSDTTCYAVSFHRHNKMTHEFELAELERELADPDVMSWIDVQAANIAPLNQVLLRLGVDLVLTNHFDEPEILPRIIEHANSLAFYLYEIANPEQHLDTSQGLKPLTVHRLLLVIGDNFVLTYHQSELDVVEHVKENCAECFRLWGRTQGFIMFLVLQRCLYDYANLNLANDNYLDKLEEVSIRGDAEQLAQGIGVAAGNILTLKKLTASLHIVLMLLGTKRSVFVSDDARRSYQDMNQNVISVRAAIDSSRDMLDGILAIMQAEATQRTGNIARVLTVVSTIILPLSLITGIYGMNFDNMPELRSPIGYGVVLGIMVTLATTLIAVFWRLGWLNNRDKNR
jgi:magnesium transporter